MAHYICCPWSGWCKKSKDFNRQIQYIYTNTPNFDLKTTTFFTFLENTVSHFTLKHIILQQTIAMCVREKRKRECSWYPYSRRYQYESNTRKHTHLAEGGHLLIGACHGVFGEGGVGYVSGPRVPAIYERRSWLLIPLDTDPGSLSPSHTKTHRV